MFNHCIAPEFLSCVSTFQLPTTRSRAYLLLLGNLDTLPQSLHDKLLAGAAAVDILDIICGRLEVASGIIALGDEDVVLGAIINGCVKRDRSALSIGQYV